MKINFKKNKKLKKNNNLNKTVKIKNKPFKILLNFQINKEDLYKPNLNQIPP